MTMIEAIQSAHDTAMERDEKVVVYGEDAGFFGGVFRCTAGLQEKYGPTRCFDAPINESGIVGTAIGMAAYGLKPCVEIQFSDYVYPAYDQIVSEAARLRHRCAGDFTCPMVIRMPVGGGIFGGQTHSQSPEAVFTHVCGLKTVMPSNPYDAKGLLAAAIEDPDPVIFMEPKRLYNGPFDGYHENPVAEAAAAEAGIDAEIIDLRTLLPLDLETIRESVTKTGRCVIVHEATRTSGYGGELATLVQEECFYSLEAPVTRVTGWDTPYPHAQEWDYFPSPARVSRAMQQVMEA